MQLPNGEQHIQGSFAHINQVAAQEAHPQPLNAGQVKPEGQMAFVSGTSTTEAWWQLWL